MRAQLVARESLLDHVWREVTSTLQCAAPMHGSSSVRQAQLAESADADTPPQTDWQSPVTSERLIRSLVDLKGVVLQGQV